MSWEPEVIMGCGPWPDAMHAVRNSTGERRRYVPERTCTVELRAAPFGRCTEHCGCCGADFGCDTRNNPQTYCPRCGARVEGADE